MRKFEEMKKQQKGIQAWEHSQKVIAKEEASAYTVAAKSLVASQQEAERNDVQKRKQLKVEEEGRVRARNELGGFLEQQVSSAPHASAHHSASCAGQQPSWLGVCT